MTWADGPWLALDTETTGVVTATDRVVTATVLLISEVDPATSRSTIDAHNWLIDPGVEIPAAATAVHGITTEYAREHGQAPGDAIAEIVDVLGKYWAPDLPAVAFNASFDLGILDAEAHRHLGRGLALGGPVVDPLVMDRAVDRYRKGGHKLDACCRVYGVQLDNAHTSSDDALAAARVAWHIANRYPEIGRQTLQQLQVWQAEQHAVWAAGFEDWLVKQKRRANATPDEIEAVRVERGWPVRSTS